MVKLYNGGAWLVNGTEIVEDNKDASAVIANLTGKAPVSKEEASKETIAYSILEKHNTSGNMDDLQIKFDKLTSHDITFRRNYPDGESFRTGKIPDSLCTDKLSQFSLCGRWNNQ